MTQPTPTADALGEIHRLQKAGLAIQNLTNLNIEHGAHVGDEARALKTAAEHLMVGPFPQYRGHWDDYKIGRVKRNIVTKGGEYCLNGDYVLYKPNACIITVSEYFTVWSFRVMCDVSVHFSDLERL